MTFLTGQGIVAQVENILQGNNPRCAVAFWGAGAGQLFGQHMRPDARIICNLSMGGTNPHEIGALQARGIQIRHNDRLHAKIYLGAGSAVVTSANASANGLGLEGLEVAGWTEAGVLVSDTAMVQTIGEWFEALWGQSSPVNDVALEQALAAWRLHQMVHPAADEFAQFQIQDELFPLITWYQNAEWEFNPELLAGLEGQALQQVREEIENGLDIDNREVEEPFLIQGRWMLVYRMTAAGNPHQAEYPTWHQIGPIIEQAFRFDGEDDFHDVVGQLAMDNPEPFPITQQFRDQFLDLLITEQFADLRDSNYYDNQGIWFTEERVALMRRFWQTLQNGLQG